MTCCAHVNADAPRSGPGSLAFSYDAVPLIGLSLGEFQDLQQIDDFLRRGERNASPAWPWSSGEEYRARLKEARQELDARAAAVASAEG
jgi:hypothetical protein